MSVTGIETNENKEPKVEAGSYLCYICHKQLETSMNVGLPKKGYCEVCNSPDTLYQVM